MSEGTTFNPSDAGTNANPFVVNPTSVSLGLAPLDQLVLAITDTGTPGTDYSSSIAGANTLVTAFNNSERVPPLPLRSAPCSLEWVVIRSASR